ncbi:transposase [bacterium]|nr:transposase [bacterium]
MKDVETRQAILKLNELGYGYRKIARTLRVSRWLVREVVNSQNGELPESKRASKPEIFRERIIEEIKSCQGNLVRVHEELRDDNIDLTYSTLTRFVRDNNLVKGSKPPVGKYVFDPGEESQFDTSPHIVTFSTGKRKCQCASLILGYSRMLFFQYYPRFTRFECKIFLTDALRYFQGACKRCIIDNTNLAVFHGTGPDALIVPEMEIFSQRFGFVFQAHRLGDKNRSGKIERPFHYIENNFLVKRVFQNFDNLNEMSLWFSDRNNRSHKRHLRSKPIELFAMEKGTLVPLPLHIPQVYQIHNRTVDQEGYINLHTNVYTVPYELTGRNLEVRETKDQVSVYHKHKEVAQHLRQAPGARKWTTDKSHRPKWGLGKYKKQKPSEEEQKLREISDVMNSYVNGLKQRKTGQGLSSIKRLYRMINEYPPDSFQKAVEEALHYGLFDLNRLENMVLRNIAGEFFRLEIEKEDPSNLSYGDQTNE